MKSVAFSKRHHMQSQYQIYIPFLCEESGLGYHSNVTRRACSMNKAG